MRGYAEFEFDLPRALLTELVGTLEELQTAPLAAGTVASIQDAQGVYQLFKDDQLVYIGKTDAEAGLRTRLLRHCRKITHRKALSGSVQFKAVRVLVFTALDLETQLIRHYRQLSPSLAAWNGTGFGSNDPGRNREKTNKAPEGFDVQFPINIDIPVETAPTGTTQIATLLQQLKGSLPYTLRYETMRTSTGRALRTQPHPDLLRSIQLPEPPYTVRTLLRLIGEVLGSAWQVTVFPSHVILYKENHTYEFGVQP
jgi:hypothetical protein